MRIIAALLVFLSTAAFANVPMLASRVTDLAAVMLHSDRVTLIERLKAIEDGNPDHPQVVILTVPTLEGKPIKDFANETFRAAKIGQAGKDNGVLILLATEDRQLRIEVGYGLEGALPDTRAAQIIDKMKPQLRKGRENYAAAFNIAIDELAPILAKAEIGSAGPRRSSGLKWFLALLVVVGAVGAVIWIERERRRRAEEMRARRSHFEPRASPSPEPPRESFREYQRPTSRNALGGAVAGAGVGAVVASGQRRGESPVKRKPIEEPQRSRSRDDYVSPPLSSSWNDSSSSSSYSSSDSSFSGGGGDSGGGGSDSSF